MYDLKQVRRERDEAIADAAALAALVRRVDFVGCEDYCPWCDGASAHLPHCAKVLVLQAHDKRVKS